MPDVEVSELSDSLQKILSIRVPLLDENRVGYVIVGMKLFVITES